MTRTSSRYLCALLAFVACINCAAESAQAWLERMTTAAQTLNYDGTFVYRNGAAMESMRIIHKADADGERSRMVSLSGAKREVLRDHSRVVCILPDDDQVVVTKTRPPSALTANVLNAKEGFADYYDLSVSGGDRVAGRITEIVDLIPQDRYRYGYRLWVDRETGLLLKQNLMGTSGPPLEQFIYTSISLPDNIPDLLLEPGISGQSLTWHINEDGGDETPVEPPPKDSQWNIGWLPEGFMMATHSALPVLAGKMPVEQYVYTDGLASLSVFVEKLNANEPLEGLSAMGAMNAYGVLIGNYQITVVGEVPSMTVEQIARSVTKE